MANEKRLIHIDDAIKKLEQELDTECELETDNDSVNERFIKSVIPKLIRDVINWLKKQPTVEAVEVVHGRWLKASVYCFDVFVCSECGCHFDVSEAMNYCPNCGADMRERKDNA